MTKLATISLLFAMAMTSILAAPARREVLRFTQPDGTQVELMPWGDEFMSMYTDVKTGKCMILDESSRFWRPMTDAEIKVTTQDWSESRRMAAAANERYKLGGTPCKGNVKVPVLLVQFSDLKFSEQWGSVEYFNSFFSDMNYDRVAYTSGGKQYHTSSVRNYFNTQSFGKFDPTFDILGPITLDNGYAYYGKDNGTTKDVNYQYFIEESINKAKQAGLFEHAKDYDFDSNGNVDLVYIIHAGWGQNENGIADYIWAKNTTRYSFATADGTYINNISASCELISNNGTPANSPDGPGVLVHEFSHALGLPDFYAVSSDADGLQQRYGMDSWSVMDQGDYSGKGQIPNNYTTHERLMLGWLSESDLDTVPTVGRIVLPPFASTGKALILHNPENHDEYITLENHYSEDNLWECCWGNSSYFNVTTNNGLLITHVDYLASAWNSNSVNNRSLHQRCSPLPADGELWSYEALDKEANNLAAGGNVDAAKALFAKWKENLRADIFPGFNNVTTLNGSNPTAKWYTGDTIAINITNIRQLEDGSIELTFGNYVEPKPIINAPDSLNIGLAWGPAGTKISQSFTITTENLKEPVVATVKTGSKFTVTPEKEENSFLVSLNEFSDEYVKDTLFLTSGKAIAKVALKGIIVATAQDGKTKETPLTTDEAVSIAHAVFADALFVAEPISSIVSTIDSAHIYGIVDYVITQNDAFCSFTLAGEKDAQVFSAQQTIIPNEIDSIQVGDTVIIQSTIGSIINHSTFAGAIGKYGIIVSHQPYIDPALGIEDISMIRPENRRKFMTREKRIIINGHDLLGRRVIF